MGSGQWRGSSGGGVGCLGYVTLLAVNNKSLMASQAGLWQWRSGPNTWYIEFLKKSILKGYFNMPSLEFVCLHVTAHIPASKGREGNGHSIPWEVRGSCIQLSWIHRLGLDSISKNRTSFPLLSLHCTIQLRKVISALLEILIILTLPRPVSRSGPKARLCPFHYRSYMQKITLIKEGSEKSPNTLCVSVYQCSHQEWINNRNWSSTKTSRIDR